MFLCIIASRTKAAGKAVFFYLIGLLETRGFMTSIFKASYFLIFQYPRATGYLVVSLSVNYEYLGFFFFTLVPQYLVLFISKVFGILLVQKLSSSYLSWTAVFS